MIEPGTVLGLTANIAAVATLVIQGYRTLSRSWGGRRVLRLRRGATIDIVVTTSDQATSHVGAAVQRPTTGLGQILGLTHATRALTRLYGRDTRPSPHFSTRVGRHQLDRDLILLGGPAKNAVTGRLLAALAGQHPELDLAFDDRTGHIRVGGYEAALDTSALGDPPARDLAIIVATQNPFAAEERRRAILCCGLTSYGTAAAADVLFERLTRTRARPRTIAWWYRVIAWPRCFLAVLEIEDPAGQTTATRMVYLRDLERGSTILGA
jgi:hypothetical protein